MVRLSGRWFFQQCLDSLVSRAEPGGGERDDYDGRKYLLNMLWDHRPGNNRFAGIVLQEYSAKQRRLVGARVNIFKGTALGFTEAPHLYKRKGWYYLLTAEGGTNWNHAVTMARSRHLIGPYELHPDKYIMSSRQRPDAELQRAGHASLVETQNGETCMAYLVGRPLGEDNCSSPLLRHATPPRGPQPSFRRPRFFGSDQMACFAFHERIFPGWIGDRGLKVRPSPRPGAGD